MQKAKIRKLNINRRIEMPRREVAEKSAVICTHFLSSDVYKNAKTIMLYMPVGNEVDITTIMDAAFRDGKRVVVPVTDAENKIAPFYVTETTQFKVGKFSVKEPQNTEFADPKTIDLVAVPGVAFDKSGNRIGFGKGCYDDFLKGINAVKAGVCYGFQICSEILADPHDVKMDYIICENGWL